MFSNCILGLQHNRPHGRPHGRPHVRWVQVFVTNINTKPFLGVRKIMKNPCKITNLRLLPALFIHFWNTSGSLLNHFWCTFGSLLEHFWSTFGALWEHFWNAFGTLLTLLDHFWSTFSAFNTTSQKILNTALHRARSISAKRNAFLKSGISSSISSSLSLGKTKILKYLPSAPQPAAAVGTMGTTDPNMGVGL